MEDVYSSIYLTHAFRESSLDTAHASTSGRGGTQDNSVILTSTFVDPHKSTTTNLPRAQRRESVGEKGGGLDPAFVRELKRKS